MSDCKGKPINCVLYRDYDGTCEKDDAPCCLLDGSGRIRNPEIDRLKAELAAAQRKIANLIRVAEECAAELDATHLDCGCCDECNGASEKVVLWLVRAVRVGRGQEEAE